MRLVVLSSREIDQPIFLRNSAIPLETALASLPGATLVAPPGFRRPLRPGAIGWLAAARTVRQADAVFWNQLHLRPPISLWALAYIRPLAHRALFALDTFESVVPDLARLIDAQRVTVCFVAYREAVAALRLRDPRLSVRWLPLGFPRDVFRDLGLPRDIYAFWLGRRHEPIHRALAAFCEKRSLSYTFSRGPNDPATIEELRVLAARSRYFVVTPPDLSDKSRTGSFSPVTSRYFEGLGAGCRLLGVPPGSGEFEALFSPGAIVACRADGSDIEDVLSAAESDPEFEDKRREAYELAHRDHGWERRAQVIYETLGTSLEAA